MLSALARSVGPVMGATALAYAYNDDQLPFRRTVHAFVAANSGDSASSTGSSQFSRRASYSALDSVEFPFTEWNDNWDMRDPSSMINKKKFAAAGSEEKRKEMLETEKATATRNIILIRHGQYNLDGPVHSLTPLGREQAALVGQRLAKAGFKFDSTTMSTMTRATETANIILDQFPKAMKEGMRISSCSLIEEGAPYPPEPAVGHWKPPRRFFSEGARIESAFRRHIHRAPPSQKEDSVEIIVCHANVIRYFVCRALQFPPEGWLRMSLGNSSITWLAIRPSGRVSLRQLGDIGHLPAEKVSYT